MWQLGAMSQLGLADGVVDVGQFGNPNAEGGPVGTRLPWLLRTIRGPVAWLIWRAAYLGKQVSTQNKILIPMHWFKQLVFGRDISRF